MARIEVRDLSRINPLEFEGGRKEYEYKWGAKNMMQFNRMRGWEVANVNEDKIKPNVLMANTGLPADGTLQTEHNILLRRKKEIGDEIREAQRQKHARALRQDLEPWKELARAINSGNEKYINEVSKEVARLVEKVGE